MPDTHLASTDLFLTFPSSDAGSVGLTRPAGLRFDIESGLAESVMGLSGSSVGSAGVLWDAEWKDNTD